VLKALFRRGSSKPLTLTDAMAALDRSAPSLKTALDANYTGRAAVLARPADGQATVLLRRDIEDALRTGEGMYGVSHGTEVDDKACVWVVVRGESLAELVRGARLAMEALTKRGLGERVVAGVFPLTMGGQPVYLLLQRRIGRFTPFAPMTIGENQVRDVSFEAQIERRVRKLLPTEPDRREWYPIWGAPV